MITFRLADFELDAFTIMRGARDCVKRHKEHEGDLNVGSLFPDDNVPLIVAMEHLISCPGLEIIIAESEEKVVGGAGVVFMPYMWNHDLLTGNKIFWWTEKTAPFRTARLLAEEVLRRIEERGAMPVFRALGTDPKGVEKLYRRLGMTPVETVYMRLP